MKHDYNRVVPLALALLNISNPDFAVIDQLSRLTHDGDAEVAQPAIMVSFFFFFLSFVDVVEVQLDVYVSS